MLTLTEDAVSAIRGLTSGPELPVETGLRIVAQADGAPFQLALADEPAAGDQVVEDDGARVFLEPAAAAILAGKSLDARVTEQGEGAFSVFDQAASSPVLPHPSAGSPAARAPGRRRAAPARRAAQAGTGALGTANRTSHGRGCSERGTLLWTFVNVAG